jgi:hypothetical protein
VPFFQIGEPPERIVQSVAFGGYFRSWFALNLFHSLAHSDVREGNFLGEHLGFD